MVAPKDPDKCRNCSITNGLNLMASFIVEDQYRLKVLAHVYTISLLTKVSAESLLNDFRNALGFIEKLNLDAEKAGIKSVNFRDKSNDPPIEYYI